MAWVGIQESGVGFSFGGGSMPAVTMLVDSVATLVDGATGGQWSISFESPHRVRVTALQYRCSYSPEGEYSYFRLVRNLDQIEQFNQSASEAPGPGDVTSWTPSPFEAEEILDIFYGFPEIGHVANEEGYRFLVEVWVEQPDYPKDRKINVRYSKDGGHNFSNWRELALPELGQYGGRVPPIRRLGSARSFTLETECTSPLVVDIMGAVISYDEAQ